MILILADTGPINYLVQIGCVNVLSELAKTVVLPASVLRELQSEGAPSAVREWAGNLPLWVEIRNTTSLIPAQPELSEADREAISLARELQALLLMDDRRARRAAREQTVNTIGTLGILEAAAAKCLISLPDALERLRATSMFISDELLAQSLQRDSKRRGV
jgi:predicted nucleic acid-binding protein